MTCGDVQYDCMRPACVWVEIEVPEPFDGVYKESRKATIDAFTEAQATLDRRAPAGQSTHGVGWVPGGANE